MKRSKTIALILGLLTLLSLGGLALAQPADTPQPVATGTVDPAQPATPAAVASPDTTTEPSPERNALDGSVSNETGKSGEEGDVTFEELFKALGKVITDFKGLGVLAGFLSLISFLMLALRIKKLNEWLEKKGWKKYKPWAAGVLGGALTGLTSAASGADWWKALIAGLFGAVTALASVGLHNLFTGGNAEKKKK